MSNKLLTGVLALGLVLIGGAASFATVPGGGTKKAILPTQRDAVYPLQGQENAQSPLPQGLARDINPAFKGGVTVNQHSVPTFVCVDNDYTDYAAVAIFGDFLDTGLVAAPGINVIGFGIVNDVEDGFICSLDGTWNYLREAGADDMTLRYSIYTATGGGVPGALVATQDFALSALNVFTIDGTGWNFIDWSSFGLYFTDDFVFTIEPVAGSSTGPDAWFSVLSDNNDGLAATPRQAVTYWSDLGPAWLPNSMRWSVNFNWVMSSVACCEELPFTDCGPVDDHLDTRWFLFSVPSTANCRQGLGMRFQSGGYDTLTSIRYYATDLGPGVEPGAELLCEVLGDDGGGVPDPTTVLFSTTVGGVGNEGDIIPFGPGADMYFDVPVGIVIPPGTDYHVTMRWVGPVPHNPGNQLYFSSDSTGQESPEHLSSVFWPGTYGTVDPGCAPPLDGWHNYFAAFGGSRDFWFIPTVCRDEFTECELVQNYTTFAFITGWGLGEGVLGFAGQYSAGGDECRIERYRGYFRDYKGIDSIRLSIYSDVAGEPGAELYGETILQGSFPNPESGDTYCGLDPFLGTWVLDVFPNGGSGLDVSGGYWVAALHYFDYTSDNCNSYMWHRLDDATGPQRSRLALDDGAGGLDGWIDPNLVYTTQNLNWATNNFRCCVPFNERTCTPGEDWPTYQHDYARTGASNNALGEAQCNLNYLWHVQSNVGANFSGSVIFGDKVLISDDGGFDCRDLATGALIWDQSTDALVAAEFVGTTGNRTQPTVAMVGDSLMTFLGTGINRDIVAVYANTGAYVWKISTGSPFAGLFPTTNNVKSVVLNDGAIDVLYFAAQTRLYAVEAATGLPYAGWATNPFVMAAENLNSVSTDGTNLFVATYSGATPGNIWAVDAASGTASWDLATSLGNAGLWAAVNGDLGYINNEGFFSGVSYDDVAGAVFANSYLDADHPKEGYLYRLDASSGATLNDPQFNVRSRRATPTLDQNSVYVPVFTKWASPTYTGGVQVFSRSTGFRTGELVGYGGPDRIYNDGVLTCEPGQDDWYIIGTELGWLNFFRVGNVNSWEFARATTFSGFAGGQWHGGSMSPDHVVFTNLAGVSVCLSPGPDRPRLNIDRPSASLPVPFGSPNNFLAVFDSMFSNVGCADLTINDITLDDVSPISPTTPSIEFTSVNPALASKMDSYANFSTNAARMAKLGMMYGEQASGVSSNYVAADMPTSVSGNSLNYRGAAFPAVVNGALGDNGIAAPSDGTLLAPGDITSIDVYIDGPLVTRGPHTFYAILDTDDPDYFLDDPSYSTAVPFVELTVVGGCLEDSTRIHFGIGGANSINLYNTANIQRFSTDGDDAVDIDGFHAGSSFGELFGGMRGYSLTPRRIAMTGASWDGSGDAYSTILGDPNYCTNECLPALQTNVLLGEYSTDGGASYTQIFGEVVALSYIDSAQDYGDPWNTTVFPDVFSNDSTIGLYANETHYGAYDVPELANLELGRIDVTNRSASDSIVDLVHWAHFDDDLVPAGAENTMQGRPNKGYLYITSPGATVAHGFIKVPFGCGVDDFSYTMRGIACDQDLSWFAWETAAYYDTMYQVGHSVIGTDSIYFQTNMNTFAGGIGGSQDASADFYFGGFDLGPSETKSFGIAHFAYTDIANPDDDDQFIGLADFVNKWAGFGRGDVNNDQSVDLADIIFLAGSVAGGNGPYPFRYLGNVDGLGDPDIADAADVQYLVDYYFGCGPCPVGDWALGLCSN